VSSGRLQKVAAALIAASALATSAFGDGSALAHGPIGPVSQSWISLELGGVALRMDAGDRRLALVHAEAPLGLAGATVKAPGWRASLFVTYLGPREAVEDESVQWRPTSFVNARLTHTLSKTARLTFDVFNIFDRRVDDLDYFAASRLRSSATGPAQNYLFHPGEPRGFRILLRKTF
jgi:hypothetical protein